MSYTSLVRRRREVFNDIENLVSEGLAFAGSQQVFANIMSVNIKTIRSWVHLKYKPSDVNLSRLELYVSTQRNAVMRRTISA